MRTLFKSPLTAIEDTPRSSEIEIGFFRPEAGMWIINAENTGAPGRGMTIETQLDTLVLQLYGYQADGNATFHIGSGHIANGESSVALNKVRGGRYFGSNALVGSYTGSDGTAEMRFTSTTKGQIRLPGEQWVDMQKLHIGPGATSPVSLLGTWSVLLNTTSGAPVPSKWNLTRINGASAVGGNMDCRFETTPHGSVRCTEQFSVAGRGTVYMADYRFTPPYGAGVTNGYSMLITPQGKIDGSSIPNRITVQRITDSLGVTVGLKSTP
ncbi:hypothetical protein [Diaphorobacter aerolatus]|uniref:Uncharacterized protein n=1 Tax=Diaphorobacter aerolatus TaxID=1288495 RepID=A0A7H0GFQ6_9BURK|nr:hypothetical protein [Diaphorobacter aerolatus]QNP47122.1 hypothetical protein H9K75_11855 [Diaphorobacter aerolatus]